MSLEVMQTLLLNFDLNGTLVLQDTSKNASAEEMLISALAENTIELWDSSYRAMSFKEYVYTILLPGDKSNPELKKERGKVVQTFFSWMKEHSHPALNRVLEDHRKIHEKFTDPVTKQIQSPVFPSFYALLEKLRKLNVPFKVTLRTFGNDLSDVAKEIEQHPAGVRFSQWGKFEKGKFSLGEKTAEKAEEIFHIFSNAEGHFAVLDDWKHWNEHGEKGDFGKPFVYDASAKKTLSLFFDDNITEEDELNIVNPTEISGQNVSRKELNNRFIFQVNTKEAICDDEYYIKRVMTAIAACKK